jgi:arginase family enzyme
MVDVAQKQLNMIPSFLGAPVGDLEDLIPGQVAITGYFCDNLERPMAGQRYLARQLRYASQHENMAAKAIDLGDVNVFPLERNKHSSIVTAQCVAVLEIGARMVLVGGDASGLRALGAAAKKVVGMDVPIVSIKGDTTGNFPKTKPIVMSIDLIELAGVWMSNPRRVTGLSPAEIITQIRAIRGNVIAAAIFGLAPSLDSRGSTETRAALAILQAVSERLEKGAI